MNRIWVKLLNLFEIKRERLPMDEQERQHLHQARYTTPQAQAADPFHARYYPKRFAELETALAEYPNLPQIALDGIYTNARLSIAWITHAYDDYSQKGNTRFFGLPDLPPGMHYPKVDLDKQELVGNLCKFIAQINFADIKGVQDYFPDHGILYFFVKSVWAPLEENFPHHVFYYEGETSALQSGKDLGITPADTSDAVREYESREGEPPYRMRAVPFISILDSREDEGEDYFVDWPPAVYDAPLAKINENLKCHSAIRCEHPHYETHSADIHTTNADIYHMFNNNPYLKASRILGGKPDDYIVLLNTDSYGADGDELYFVISKQDLKARNFSNMYCTCTWWTDW